MTQCADAKCVDQRVALVNTIENRFTTDVRQTQAVAIERDAANHAVHNAGGVRVIRRSEAKLIHDGDWACAHGQDVANNAANARGRALKRLDIARVVVALDLEGNRPALANVNNAGVFTHANHQVLLHLVGDFLTELTKVDLRRLVRAVLRPHDRIHCELGTGWSTTENLNNSLILVELQTEFFPRLRFVWSLGCVGSCVNARCNLLFEQCHEFTR